MYTTQGTRVLSPAGNVVETYQQQENAQIHAAAANQLPDGYEVGRVFISQREGVIVAGRTRDDDSSVRFAIYPKPEAPDGVTEAVNDILDATHDHAATADQRVQRDEEYAARLASIRALGDRDLRLARMRECKGRLATGPQVAYILERIGELPEGITPRYRGRDTVELLSRDEASHYIDALKYPGMAPAYFQQA